MIQNTFKKYKEEEKIEDIANQMCNRVDFDLSHTNVC